MIRYFEYAVLVIGAIIIGWHHYKQYKYDVAHKFLAKLEDGIYIRIGHGQGRILHF